MKKIIAALILILLMIPIIFGVTFSRSINDKINVKDEKDYKRI